MTLSNLNILFISICIQVLEYISSVTKKNCNNKLVIKTIIQHSLTRICSVSMFCEDSNICKRITNEIINTIVNISVSQPDNDIKYVSVEIMIVKNRLGVGITICTRPTGQNMLRSVQYHLYRRALVVRCVILSSVYMVVLCTDDFFL